MFKRAIGLFAFSIFLFGCAARMANQPLPPPSLAVPPPEPKLSETSLSKEEIELVQKEEAKEEAKEEVKQEVEEDGQKEEKIALKPEVPVEPLLLPDITITDLFLNSKKRLVITIENQGDGPFPLEAGKLRLFIDSQPKGSYPLSSFSDQSFLLPEGSLTFTTHLTISGRHEIHAYLDASLEIIESNQENNDLTKILEGLPVGPDIVVEDLELTEDLELSIVLSNAGEVDLRKGIILRIRISVNNQKITAFDHFIPEVLKANFGNRYIIDPPYPVGITGISEVKVSISPKLSSDDIRVENNVLERTFIIFPFKIGPQGKEEFSFSFFTPRPQGEGQTEKVKIEARWEGGSSSLMLSFKKSGNINEMPTLSGKSPLKVEFSIPFEEVQKENVWSIFVTNLVDKKVEGHLIIQHP